jgi:hypothetical protein
MGRENSEPLMALAEARAAVLADRTARLLVRRDWEGTPPLLPGCRGLLARVLRKFAARAAHMGEEGVVEFDAARAMTDLGGYAQTQIGEKCWAGRSGRPLSDRNAADKPMSAFWLWDLAAAALGAADDGVEAVRGTECRRLRLIVDARVGRSGPAGALYWQDSPAPRVFVCLDDTHVRRIRLVAGVEDSAAEMHRSVEFWDFGVDTSSLDWDRFATFGTDTSTDEPRGNAI